MFLPYKPQRTQNIENIGQKLNKTEKGLVSTEKRIKQFIGNQEHFLDQIFFHIIYGASINHLKVTKQFKNKINKM